MRIILLLALAAQLAISVLCPAQQPCKSTVIGDLHIDQFDSKIYGRQMTVRIWLPPGYGDSANAAHKYPVLYLFDGQTAFDECTAFHGEHELQVDETVTRLIDERKIPPIIVVGIDSTERRNYEYSPYKDTIADARAPEPIGRQLPTFLADEVMPFVSLHYRVTDSAAQTGIGGTSLGGSAALYVSLARPDLFRLALIQSPNLMLGNGRLLRDSALVARAPDRIAIGVGTTELNFPGIDAYLAPLGLTRSEVEAGGVTMNRILASNLQTAFMKHSLVNLVVDPGANHSSESWARRIPDAIIFLYGSADAVH
jgi:enterochelin esterase-like enzyme